MSGSATASAKGITPDNRVGEETTLFLFRSRLGSKSMVIYDLFFNMHVNSIIQISSCIYEFPLNPGCKAYILDG